mgnify:CR=1 FL=1
MINVGYLRWKQGLQQRELAADVAAAQADATTGIADAADAQDTADTALETATEAQTKAVSVEQQAEALAATAGQVNAPSYSFAGSPLIIVFYCTTGGSTIHYKVNGSGGWNTYSTPVTLTAGDYIEAYATAGGLTDSGITRYDS